MSDEAAREEALLNKYINRNRKVSTNAPATKTVFGGGLEAARAQAGIAGSGGGAPPAATVAKKPAPATGLEAARANTGGSSAPRTSGVRTAPAPTPAPAKVPPPIEAEVVELSLPPPAAHASFTPPPLQEEVVDLPLFSSNQDEEEARKEEERMSKAVGKFHLGPKPTPSGPPKPSPTPTQPASTVQPSYGYSSAPVGAPQGKPRKDWELPPTTSQYNTKFENFLYAEICLARSSPETIVDRLRDRRNHYRGKDYINPESGTVLQTQEGVAGVDSAIRFLSTVSPLRTKLKQSDGLSLSARDFCDFMSTSTSPHETDEQAENRFSRYGTYSGALCQNVAFSNVPPSELILDWIIDDGQEANGRSHRQAIFDPSLTYVGIASGPHTIGRVICVLFTQDYHLLGEEHVIEEVALPLPASLPSSGGPSKNSDYVYPNFQLGALTPLDNTANVLPVTNLACDISELYLGIRQNGNAIEFSRTVQQGGKPRKEVQLLNLPYPVTPQTLSAKYFPNKSNGELLIRLGKQLANADGALTLEFEIARFTVLPDPFTSSTRVQIEINQQPDHFVFFPGPASKYSTDFVVVLNGNALEFRSTYSFQEGDNVKTINGKQTIQLPVPPSMDQIDIDGSTVTIWPNRSSGKGPSANIPNTDITILMGF